MLLVGGRRSSRSICIGDLHRNEHWRSRQLLLPTEHSTCRYPVPARHFGEGCTGQHRLVDDLALVCLAVLPAMTLAPRRTIGPDVAEPQVI